MNMFLNTWLWCSLRLNPHPSPPQSVPVTRTALWPLCRPNLELWGVFSMLIPRAAHIAYRPRTADFCFTKRPPTSTGSRVSASLCLQTFLSAWLWLGGTVQACGHSWAVAFEVLTEKSVIVILGYVALTWDELKENKKIYFWPRTSLHRLYSWLLLSYRSHFGLWVSA